MRGARRVVIGILLLLPLSTIGYAAVGDRTASARGWQVTRLPVAPHAATSFSEPGVAAGPHGVLVENACTANSGSPSTFWRSVDNGRTWSRGFPIGSSAIGCGDSDAAVGGDGYLYSLTLGTGVQVYRSRDGKTWRGPAAFPPPHGIDQPDRPWLVLVPRHPNQVLVFNSEVGGNIVEWRSTDHAATFHGPIPVTGGLNSEAALALGSRPIVEPGNPARIVLFYETAGAAALAGTAGGSQFPLTQLWEASSDDGGATWDNHLVLDVTTAFGVSEGSLGHLLPAPAVDRAGNEYVVLSVRLGSATQTRLFLIHRRRGGAWSRPSSIRTATPSNVMPALAVVDPGHLFVSWYASQANDYDDTSARWAEMVATSHNGLAPQPRFSSQRLSGSTPVHVGAVDNMGAIGFDLGQDWALRDFQSVTVDRCGSPHVTWAADYRSTATFAATVVRPAAPGCGATNAEAPR